MAYILWRVFIDNYFTNRREIHRNPILIINPTKSLNKKCITEAWTDKKSDEKSSQPTNSVDEQQNTIRSCSIATSEFEETNISNSRKLEIPNNVENTSSQQKSSIGDFDPNTTEKRNKSRVRLYLKKCKDRLTGQNTTSTSQIQHHDDEIDDCSQFVDCDQERIKHQDNLTSWYINEKEPPDISNINPNNLKIQLISDCHSTEEIFNENLESGIADLIDKYLASLYPMYYERTRAILIRQARDLLVCTYSGCLETFEDKFLKLFTQIATKLKKKHSAGQSITWCKGWPLATESGDVILHLGTIDESFLRPLDIYICVKPVDDSKNSELCTIWRSQEFQTTSLPSPIDPTSKITSRIQQYRIIDWNQEILSPLSLEMLTDELSQLLQNLLVGVERAIERIPLTELSFPTNHQTSTIHTTTGTISSISDGDNCTLNDRNGNNNNNNNNNNNEMPNQCELIDYEKFINSPKCALKRSDLITKNKMLNNKYILRRYSNKYNDNKIIDGDEHETNKSINNNELKSNIISTPMNTICTGITANITEISGVDPITTTPALPVFCLGYSFPHIDSDEENTLDERKISTTDHQLPEDEIIAPRSILELPEKLLTSGIELPGTRDMNGKPIITIDANCINKAGLNCYEVATVLLYYSTINENTSSSYTILLQLEAKTDYPVIDIICNSLNLCTGNLRCDEILAICLDKNLFNCRPNCDNKVHLISTEQLIQYIQIENIPIKLGGRHQHDQNKWCEFFKIFDPFQNQCITTGQRLVNAMSDIRTSDLQGLPTRRQLYSQHRALSRALMDTELQYLRKRGSETLNRLQDITKYINKSKINNYYTKSLPMKDDINSSVSSSTSSTSSSSAAASAHFNINNTNNNSSVNCSTTKTTKTTNINNFSTTTTSPAYMMINHFGQVNEDVNSRLNKIIILFNEVDRATKRLEHLTEQRRERLRELTRQRTLEDEINEVTLWIKNDGEENLQRFTNVQLDCEDVIKDHEQDFEKYYFVSMKHLAKGSDLYDAAIELDNIKDNATILKTILNDFSERLERVREKIEGASRLHHLLSLQIREDDIQLEMQRLADKIGVPGLIEKYRNRRISHHIQQLQQQQQQQNSSTNKLEKLSTMKLNYQQNFISSTTSDRLKSPNNNNIPTTTTTGDDDLLNCNCWRNETSTITTIPTINNITNNRQDYNNCTEKLITRLDNNHDEDEEEHSKIADSGLGGCDRCEGNTKLTRVCSCQSFDETGNMCDKSHNSDELEEDCFERNSKQFLDAHSPIEANAHLQCHTSNLDLSQMEELSSLDPKIQKQLLLIIREMIVTERDYVRSLYYVIENYVDELLRDNIPQAMRGQRNVIFGNLEKIFEFHQPHFLTELEQYETNPLKVGAAFLENESKFYLYALYNKNKPKSDTLMSEYGTSFFKSKQIELNDKMDLASYLLKPVQRMGKYALLLQQLVKACNNVTGPVFQDIAADVEELQRAEEMVKFQLRHGNDLLAMDSLRDCDVNVKEQGRLLRQNEFLVWQGRGGKKCLRQIFLFEELVLFSKARRFPDHKNLDIYIYKNSIKTSDIGLTAHVSDSSTKLEIWFRKRKPEDTWTLQSMSEDIKNAWTDEVSKLLWKQAKRNREIRLAEMSSMGIGNKPCLDIRPSHNQINDRSITISQLGKAPKLRHSFAGTLPETNKSTNRRPNSLISESSLSSGTSSSSLSTGSANGNNNCKNPGGLELINETTPLNTTIMNTKKHQRSTTLVSQLSMESGIMSDISMTPDTENHNEPNWPSSSTSSSLSRKSSSTNSSKSYKSDEQTTSNNSNDNNFNKNNLNKISQNINMPTNSELNLAEQDPYVGDSVTVHL